jgi:hypothetical protein
MPLTLRNPHDFLDRNPSHEINFLCGLAFVCLLVSPLVENNLTAPKHASLPPETDLKVVLDACVPHTLSVLSHPATDLLAQQFRHLLLLTVPIRSSRRRFCGHGGDFIPAWDQIPWHTHSDVASIHFQKRPVR